MICAPEGMFAFGPIAAILPPEMTTVALASVPAAARAERRSVVNADRDEHEAGGEAQPLPPRDTHDRRPCAPRVGDHELTDDRAGDELVEVAEESALRELHRRPV